MAGALCGCRMAGSSRERDRGLENCFHHLGSRAGRREKLGRDRRNRGSRKGPDWWPGPKGLGVHMEGNTLPCALLHTLLF